MSKKNIMNLTIKEAQETKIFFINEDNEIESTDLYDFIMQSVDETTTPEGVAPRFFVEKIELRYVKEEIEDDIHYEYLQDEYRYIDIEDFQLYSGVYCLDIYTISSWGAGGNHYKKGTEYWLSEEEAKNQFFLNVYEFDFLPDDQRDTQYWEDEIEAYEDCFQVDYEVAESILAHKKCAERIRQIQAEKKSAEQKRLNEIWNQQAMQYAELIEPKAESFKETAARLSEAIGEKINKTVFFKAVKLIRKKYHEAK